MRPRNGCVISTRWPAPRPRSGAWCTSIPWRSNRSATVPSGFGPAYCSGVRKYPHGGSSRIWSGVGASTGGGPSPGCGAGNAGIGRDPRNTIRPVFDVWNAIESATACWIAAVFARK